MRKPIYAAFSALALSVTATAYAEVPESQGVPSVTVKYADLDLTRQAGTEALDARIDRAVDKVCAKPDVRELKANKEFEACQAAARDAAMEQLSLTNPFEGIALASAF